MTDTLVFMPKKDWQMALDATRAKTGKFNTITSSQLAAEISSIKTDNGVGGSEDSLGTGNCEVVTIPDIQNPTSNFQTNGENLEVWGWGQGPKKEQQAPFYLFLGNKYSEYVGGPTVPMNLFTDDYGAVIGLPKLVVGEIIAIRKIQ